MQIQSKKNLTLSPASGTPVVGRRGSIVALDATANKTFVQADNTAGLYYQIGSSLKIESTGKPIRIRARYSVTTGNGSTQQTAHTTMFIGVKRVDIAGNYIANTFNGPTTVVEKLYNVGNIADYVGIPGHCTIDVVDPNATTLGEIYEYQFVGNFISLRGDVNTAIVTAGVSVYSFEIEEVI